MDHSYAKGGCLCGKVDYAVAMPAQWSAHCHCRQCQVLHGAAFVTWVGFKTADYRIDDPHRLFRLYNSGRAERGFCGQCGSRLSFRYTASCEGADYIFFTRASLTTPLTLLPESHIYYGSHADWFTVTDGLPQRMD